MKWQKKLSSTYVEGVIYVPAVFVELGNESYPIYIEQGGLANLGRYMTKLNLTRNALIVTNPVIRHYYGDIVTHSLESAGFSVYIEELPAGEETKTMASAMRLYDRAIALGMDRKSPLIALGGGVIGDLSGFVAATYMRGIPFIQVPTTLLSQVDSSVGGKVAVNHPQGKNLIGAFYQPQLVLIDPTTLNTLTHREWLSGLAEVIKYGVIWDRTFFASLASEALSSLIVDMGKMEEFIKRSCEIKANVVSQDEKETGIRVILNYGHTIGHALESATDYTLYTHGEAIAIGMVGAAKLAQKLGWLNDNQSNDIEAVIVQYGLPTSFSGIDHDLIIELLYHDKKKEGSAVRWVLPRSIGSVDTTKDVPEMLIREVLGELSR
jgi:3-dehydroquinate synthase